MVMARVLHLTKGYVAIVSEEDFRRCAKISWHVHVSRGTKKKPGQPYARATINGMKVYLHRFVMEAPEFMQVDHRNHQTLDCRRQNLIICDHAANQKNRRNVKRKIIHKKHDDRQTALDLGKDHGNNRTS